MLQLTGEDPQIHQSAVIQSMQSWSNNFLRWIFGLKKNWHCLHFIVCPDFLKNVLGLNHELTRFFPWIWIWSLFVPHISRAHDCLATGQDHGQIWYTNWCLRAVDTWCLFIHVFDFCLFLICGCGRVILWRDFGSNVRPQEIQILH